MIRKAMALWMQRNSIAAFEVVPAAPQDVPQPVSDAPVVAEAPQPGDPILICAICQSAMGSASEYGESEALACAHVYHRMCLDQYCSATGKTRSNCCPFKCNASAYVTVQSNAEDTPAGAVAAEGSSGWLASLADDSDLQMAAAARSQALQMIE